MTALLNPEVSKYLGIYADAHRAARYGHTCHGTKALPLVEEWSPESLVDIGCGWNEFAGHVRQLPRPPLNVVGVDFACPGADVIADATHLPFERKQFDCLTAFDMLEHLRPEQVNLALAEMARISKRFIFSISYVDSVNPWQGQTLHPTVMPEAWWIQRLMQAGAGDLRKEGHYICGQWLDQVLTLPASTSCVLVGNGPSLMSGKHGARIDKHDEVVRFNECRVQGYEEHVGSRTTLWSTFGKGTVPADADMRPQRVLYIHGETGGPSIPAAHIYRLPRYFFNDTQALVRSVSTWQAEDKARLMPSSGLLIARWLLEVVGLTQLTLAGLDHFSKTQSSQHHYWNPGPFGRPKEHDGDAEKALFMEWLKAGRCVPI